MVSRTLLKFTAARVPLIKFRKGGNVVAATATPTADQTPQAYSAHAIEDWELPPRYWRKPIDTIEMDYINRGGPA